MNTAPAACAATPATSRGRVHAEPSHPYRDEYQRDRDRVIHSTAFRRLVYKTQVFVNHEGDLYRTRLTHSLEVAQIARTVARELGLNEMLTEAICLAHDLGHTPFGHAGQDALNAVMRPYGGFEHNLQSLRVVDEIEQKYPAFPGINLTFEAREGILKHCSRRNAEQLGEIGERFLRKHQPGLEAQLANLADAIAYNNHDVDDGLRSGLISVDELSAVDIFREHWEAVGERYPDSPEKLKVQATVRGMINTIVTDLVNTTRANLESHQPDSIEAVRLLPGPMVSFSEGVLEKHLALKRFLNKRLYRHPQVQAMTDNAASVVSELFAIYLENPAAMPEKHSRLAAEWETKRGEKGRARAVADYVAGMTDRYALSRHEELTGS